MARLAFAAIAFAAVAAAEPGFFGSATVTVTTDGQTAKVPIPFPTKVVDPSFAIPIAESVFLGGKKSKREADPGLFGKATVTVVTDGQTVTVPIPFPTGIVPPGVAIPIAESIFLGSKSKRDPEPGLFGKATVTVVTDGQTVTVPVPFPTGIVPPGVAIPIAESIFLGSKSKRDPEPGLFGKATVTVVTDGQTVTVPVPFPTGIVPPGVAIPIAESIFLGSKSKRDPEPSLFGKATVTVVTDGQTVTVPIPFPTGIVPPGVAIPIAESIFLGSKSKREPEPTGVAVTFKG